MILQPQLAKENLITATANNAINYRWCYRSRLAQYCAKRIQVTLKHVTCTWRGYQIFTFEYGLVTQTKTNFLIQLPCYEVTAFVAINYHKKIICIFLGIIMDAFRSKYDWENNHDLLMTMCLLTVTIYFTKNPNYLNVK